MTASNACYGMTACGMGEPKIYGGYGSGATAVQVPYTGEPKPKKQLPVYEKGKKADWEKSKYSPCVCLETGQRFKSLADCCKELGIKYNSLRSTIRRHPRGAKVDGYTIAKEKYVEL